MVKIRVLVVEAAVVVRRLVANALAGDPALEVAGTAASGALALAKIPQVNPDLVLLGVTMPEVDGEDPVTTLRKAYPLLPVLLFNNPLDLSNTRVAGGSDYRLPGEVEAATPLRPVGELIPRIKAFYARFLGVEGDPLDLSSAQVRGHPARKSSAGFRRSERVEIVAVGASTGGPQALAALLAPLSADCPVPVVIVQHVLNGFTGFLAHRLASQVQIGVREAASNDVPSPGQALIAPGGQHLELPRTAEGVRVRLHQGPPENSCRPSVDVLFRSVADTYGPGVLAVVLTGMGKDALRGCEAVRAAGGQVLVQDEDTSVVWGMAGMVARAGLADQVLPLPLLGPEVLRRVRRGRSLSSHPSKADG